MSSDGALVIGVSIDDWALFRACISYLVQRFSPVITAEAMEAAVITSYMVDNEQNEKLVLYFWWLLLS